MIIDSSAMVAILRSEPEQDEFTALVANARRVGISAAGYLEAGVVLDSGRNPSLSRQLDDTLRRAEIEIIPVTASQAYLARQAYRDFGKGSGHPARLNFGDCFAYALAKDLDEPLLFKGEDFIHTDVRRAR